MIGCESPLRAILRDWRASGTRVQNSFPRSLREEKVISESGNTVPPTVLLLAGAVISDRSRCVCGETQNTLWTMEGGVGNVPSADNGLAEKSV